VVQPTVGRVTSYGVVLDMQPSERIRQCIWLCLLTLMTCGVSLCTGGSGAVAAAVLVARTLCLSRGPHAFFFFCTPVCCRRLYMCAGSLRSPLFVHIVAICCMLQYAGDAVALAAVCVCPLLNCIVLRPQHAQLAVCASAGC
jgi:hypothetical protein